MRHSHRAFSRPLLPCAPARALSSRRAAPAAPEAARPGLLPQVRLARTTMADTGGAGTKDIPGFGAAGFSFAQTRLTTQFVSASASTPQLDAVRSFVLKHVG